MINSIQLVKKIYPIKKIEILLITLILKNKKYII